MPSQTLYTELTVVYQAEGNSVNTTLLYLVVEASRSVRRGDPPTSKNPGSTSVMDISTFCKLSFCEPDNELSMLVESK